ncbi:MAG: hypothetical protein ACREK8_09955 [Gemmatimonadales bacterium]
MRRPFCLLFLLFPLAALNAQWRVAAMAGSADSRGDARNEDDPDQPEFHAERPVTLALALGHEQGRWRINLEARRTTADLSEVSHSVGVTTYGAFSAWGAALEFQARLAGSSAGPAAWAGLGAGLDRWSLDGARARWREVARGSIAGEFPMGRGWRFLVRGEASAGPSLFIKTELPEGFTPRMTWRTGITLGVAREFGARQP